MNLVEELTRSPKLMQLFQRERLAIEITELLCQLMEEQDITNKDLAKRLGLSKKKVISFFQKDSKMTVEEISDLFFALGLSLRVVAVPLSINTPRLRVMEEES